MSLRVGLIVWGVRDLPRAVEFWQAALGLTPREEPTDDWALLIPPDGGREQFAIMRVSSPAARRHHLDLHADDREAGVGRLIALGATLVEDWDYEDGAEYIVLADPDGNPFCVDTPRPV